jgi:UDP-galactopyranose mutase
MSRVLIVGAGFYGATMAHQLHKAGHDVLVIDRRDHLAGNAFTRWSDEAGCHEHVYGAHLFHTSNPVVWDFVRSFGEFNSYRHRIKARAYGRLYSFPINLMTINQVFEVDTPELARKVIAKDCVPCADPQNMEQHCLATIGKRLFYLFIDGYTRKQWGRFPRDLPASIIKRIPVRFTYNDDYFDDAYQGIPVDGYTKLVRNMLRGVRIELGRDFSADDVRQHDLVVYTGGVDEFFSYAHGKLGYRSLRFERAVMPVSDFQGTSVMNLCDDDTPATRIIEHSHFTGAMADKALLTFEHPASEGEPFYPILTPENDALLTHYRALAKEHFPNVVFGGRLGEYRYLDMHQVIACALAKSRELMERLR